MVREDSPDAVSSPGRLGRFILLQSLPGGTHERFIARRAGREGFVVVKRLPKAREKDGAALAQLFEEARVGSLLRHPNLTRLVEAGVEAGVFCISSELVSGVTLRDLLDRALELGRPFPAPVAVAIARSLLEGLGHAHSLRDESGTLLGLSHGSPNPSSVLISFRGEVRLGDFGAGVALADPAATAVLAYWAPEQARPHGVASSSSDLYAVGIMLFEMLTGRNFVPRGRTRDEALTAVAEGKTVALSEVAPQLSPVLSSVVEQALAREPALRFPSAVAFREALGRVSPIAQEDSGHIAGFIAELLPDAEKTALATFETWKRADPSTSGSFSSPSASADRPAVAKTELVARRRRGSKEPLEKPERGVPSFPGTAVLDMPGEAVPPGKTSIDWLIRRDRRPYSILVLLAGIAIGLLVAVLLSGRRAAAPTTDRQPVAIPRAREGASQPVASPARGVPSPVEDAVGGVVEAEEEDESAQARRRSRRRAPSSDAGPSRSPVERERSERAGRLETPPAEAAAVALPTDSSGPETLPATPREPRSLREALAKLRATPKQDPRGYLELRDDIERAATGVPSSARARIRSDLNAADLTYSLDALERAIAEIESSQAAVRAPR